MGFVVSKESPPSQRKPLIPIAIPPRKLPIPRPTLPQMPRAASVVVRPLPRPLPVVEKILNHSNNVKNFYPSNGGYELDTTSQWKYAHISIEQPSGTTHIEAITPLVGEANIDNTYQVIRNNPTYPILKFNRSLIVYAQNRNNQRMRFYIV